MKIRWKPGRLQVLAVIASITILNILVIMLQPNFIEITIVGSLTGLTAVGMKILESE